MGYVNIPADLSGYSKSNSGSYTGQDSVNYAVPHGINRIPLFINIQDVLSGYFIRILKGSGNIWYLTTSEHGHKTVTAPDSTNFYVGNVSNYTFSANLSPRTYIWEAFG